MNLRYAYPTYQVDLTTDRLNECVEVAVKLLQEVGLMVRHGKFLEAIRTKSGFRLDGERVRFDEALVRSQIERFIARTRESLEKRQVRTEGPGLLPAEDVGPGVSPASEWTVACGGFSMDLIDAETDEVRPATCQDLRDLIRLVNSFGLGGNYPVMPQDLPPLMRALACFKICWETSDNIRPFDYQHIRQTPFLYEMHQVMGQPFTITLCVPQPLRIDEKDLEIFLHFYPAWKRGEAIDFWILDYPMLGITKPITSTGCLAMTMANMFGVRTLFNRFDEELELPVGLMGGLPTDLRHVCWAWGHPRQHLYAFLNARILAQLCGLEPEQYVRTGTLLESSSSAVDEQAALEKMGVAMVAAFQGARSFSGAGSLCVDDLFSGVQFVLDLEIVRYIREVVEAFQPHPDLVSTEGLYELLRDVSLERDEFLSHPDTVARFRNILPSSGLIRREKLRSWLGHRKRLKDRAREECLDRIRSAEQKFHLPSDQQQALDRIYRAAEAELTQ